MYPNFSEFGLYRYESSAHQKNRNGIYSSIIIYSILAMSIIFGALLFVFISTRFYEATNKFSNSTKLTKINVTEVNAGLEVIEISNKNASELHSKRIKRLDSEDESSISPESQKLIFFPSRTLKPPRINQKPKVVPYETLPPNHKMSSRKMDPRPFQRGTLMPRPHEFLKPPTARSFHQQMNNVQDGFSANNLQSAMKFQQVAAASQIQPQIGAKAIKLSGTYRHPRTNSNLAQIFQQSNVQLQAAASDPLETYRPISPSEVNHLLNQQNPKQNPKYMTTTTPEAPYFRRKFRQQIASIPNYAIHAKDAANIYGNVLQTGKHVQDRHEGGNPFSIMLDVIPLGGDDNNDYQQMMQMQKMSKFRPLMSRYYQDPQFFNTMNFPQLPPRYPSYFRYQHQPQASTNYGTIPSNGMMKPSQLVVHLNLYPKNNSPTFKRSSNEDANEMRKSKQQQQQEIQKSKAAMRKNQTIEASATPLNINFNLNTNGHPENIMHQQRLEFNRTSTEPTMGQSYYYDDDMEGDDQSMSNVSPSLIYKDVYRDRPYHLMLRNTTNSPSTTKKPINAKINNHNFRYQSVERPKLKYFNYAPKSLQPKAAFAPFF